MSNVDIVCAKALLRLREIKDLIDQAILPLGGGQEDADIGGLLFTIGDALQQHGLALEQLGSELLPEKSDSGGTLTPMPLRCVTTQDLPSDIPEDEEPESAAYLDDTDVRKAMRFAMRRDPKEPS